MAYLVVIYGYKTETEQFKNVAYLRWMRFIKSIQLWILTALFIPLKMLMKF